MCVCVCVCVCVCHSFDLILDNVGGDTESWAMDLLKPWAGSKFVTLVSPLLRNNDSLGLVDGVLQSGMTLHDKAIRVRKHTHAHTDTQTHRHAHAHAHAHAH